MEDFHVLPDPLQRSLHPPCCECGLFMAHSGLLLQRTAFSRTEATSPRLHPCPPRPSSGKCPVTAQSKRWDFRGWGWRSILWSSVYGANSHGTRLQLNFSQDHILSSSLALSCFLHSPFLKDTLSISYLHGICKSRDPYLSQK